VALERDRSICNVLISWEEGWLGGVVTGVRAPLRRGGKRNWGRSRAAPTGDKKDRGGGAVRSVQGAGPLQGGQPALRRGAVVRGRCKGDSPLCPLASLEAEEAVPLAIEAEEAVPLAIELRSGEG